ncbi:hypothetical protein GCM10027345_21670 [Hymenobacter daeguensis]
MLLLFGLGLGFARPAHASHAQGGSLTYTSLGGNSYRVRADFIRDCSGISAPTSFTLNCQTTCGGTSLTTTLVPVGQPFIDAPYSSAVQPLVQCPLNTGAPVSTPANYAVHRYEGTVTLAPNQWILAVEEASRPMVTNLSSAGTVRLEATLDNRGRTNTSVVFSNIPTLLIPVNQLDLLHIGAFDADGDSLSYSLERPLNGCNSYEPYAVYPTTSCTPLIDPRCGRRLINCGNSSNTYTQSSPMAVTMDTVFENGSTTRPACPPNNIVVATVQPRFAFSALQGTFAFTPNRYLPTASANGDNKYVAVVKVTEWRRENGVYVAIGTTRRDMLWVVYNTPTASMPSVAPMVTVQNGSQTRTQALTTPIAVQAGEPVSVGFTATTTGSTPLAFTLEQNTVPGAVIQAGATAGTGRLTFTPPLSLPNGTYRVSVSVTDDASPLRNLTTVPVTFHVYRTTLATRGAAAQSVSAYPTPFTEQVQFQLPTAGVQQLTVCDNLGRVVAHLTSQPDGKVQWAPAASVPAGLYSARSADGKLTVRLLRSTAQ